MRLSSASRLLVFTLVVLMLSSASFAQIGISITIGPPPIPVYAQPVCPAPGYMWTPGYWAWGPYGYYWVPGTWVLPPAVGLLWTPGWWGWGGSAFIWHVGFWGPHVGFYGGINYGYGYPGTGFYGGRWEGGNYFYNRSVTNVTNITNVYNTTVVNKNVSRVSYNGGNGGIEARPSPEEEAAEREKHSGPTSVQTHQEHAALTDPQLRASENHGKPPVAATPRAGVFNDHGIEPAKEAGGPYRAENNVPRPPNASGVVHAKDLPQHQRPMPPNTGNEKLNQKYQDEQNKLYAKQEQEHQKMVQQQEREHQQAQQRNFNQAQQQQMEQRHQQQTQQMEERHAQEQDRLQARQQAKPGGGGGRR
jgi:WXXGXW repeat (2 copies)